MRVCKFRHNGLCCNSGSAFYKQECKNCEAQIPLTNGDRIRSMTDEELALLFVTDEGFHWVKSECALSWLKQPAEEDT